MAIAFIQSTAHPTAHLFYKEFPQEPVLPNGELDVSSSVRLKSMTAISLLIQLKKRKNQVEANDIVVVSHGVPPGLSIDLVPPQELLKNRVTKGLEPKLQFEELRVLQENASSQISDREAADRLFQRESTFRKFKREMEEVQSFGIARVEFRSCNVGMDESTLSQLRWFFGARLAGAPKVFDLWGIFDRPSDFSAKSVTTFVERHPDAVVENNGGFAYRVNRVDDTRVNLECRASSEAAVREWYRRHFIGGVHPLPKLLVIHGFYTVRELVLPADAQYRQLLTVVS